MYITTELTDNIGIRKILIWDVKVNPPTLAKQHHHRGTRGGGGWGGVDGTPPLGFYWQYFENCLST